MGFLMVELIAFLSNVLESSTEYSIIAKDLADAHYQPKIHVVTGLEVLARWPHPSAACRWQFIESYDIRLFAQRVLA